VNTSPSSIQKLSPVFVAVKCCRCDFVTYGERDLEARDLLRGHRCDEEIGIRTFPPLDSMFGPDEALPDGLF
jgi:hypothetical protein